MEQLLYPTHKAVVIAFLAIYVIKTILLFANQQNALNSFRRITRIPEMVISVLFLVTGVWMLINLGTISTFQIIKLALVFGSIPLAVIGFKKGNKALAGVSLLFIIGAYGLAEMNAAKKRKAATNATVIASDSVITDPAAANYNAVKHGAYIYANLNGMACTSCHGAAGDAMIGGASDLTKTMLTKEQIVDVIKNGRNEGKMPPYAALSDAERNALADYVLSLKK